MQYAIGADPAGGVGKDNSVIEVYCLNTGQQVAEWVSNTIAPDTFATHIAELGEEYNKAFLTVESNNHGVVTIDELMDIYDVNLIYQKERTQGTREQPKLMSTGFRTTARTKPLMIGKLRKMLAKTLTIYSSILADELSTFVEHEDGSMGAQEGCMDDTVMASANCVMGWEEAAIYTMDGRDRDWETSS